jgi:hypothetical protein
MRFTLIDLLIPILLFGIGSALLPIQLNKIFPESISFFVSILMLVCIYLIFLPIVYRGFKLFPMWLPRCPCCNKHRNGFHFKGEWPRFIFKCPSCGGEFIVWTNSSPNSDETYEKPVLSLKWPYAFGRYIRVLK